MRNAFVAEEASRLLQAYEDFRTERAGVRRHATRLRKMFERHGAVDAVERLVGRAQGSDGFSVVMEASRPDLAFESIVLTHPDAFRPETVDRARRRLLGSSRYWWVNHKQTYRQEVGGGYLWSPKKNQNGARNESYDNMARVRRGDVVFSFANAAIRAVGIALGSAREQVKPKEFGRAGRGWAGGKPGWFVPVRFARLDQPLKPKDHKSALKGVLPEKYSPIQANGAGNQGAYLSAVPPKMARRVMTLLGTQAKTIVANLKEEPVTDSLSDQAEEQAIEQRTDIGSTKKLTLVNARRGQGLYRRNLEKIEKGCRVTGSKDRAHLKASHIKPWCRCNDREKLDGYNGLLLAPHVDHLFDGGYLTFEDDGTVKVSQHLDRRVLTAWGLHLPSNVGGFKPAQCRYLQFHRTEVFERPNGGR